MGGREAEHVQLISGSSYLMLTTPNNPNVELGFGPTPGV